MKHINFKGKISNISFSKNSIDGGILTFEASHPKWSYTKINEEVFVNEIAYKKPKSKHATFGVYYWNKGSDFVKYAEQMINKDKGFNNFYHMI